MEQPVKTAEEEIKKLEDVIRGKEVELRDTYDSMKRVENGRS